MTLRIPTLSFVPLRARERGRRGDIEGARDVFEKFRAEPARVGESGVFSSMATVYLDARRDEDAKALLDQLPPSLQAHDAVEAAILERRAGRQERAHQLFVNAGDAVQSDSRALLEFARTKARLAGKLAEGPSRPTPHDHDARLRLLRDAREMLRRVLQLDAPAARHAWAWFELGRVLRWLREPEAEVRHAFENACKLLPGEPRFQEELQRLSGGEES